MPFPESLTAGWLRTKYAATAIVRLIKRYLTFRGSARGVGGPLMVFKVTYEAVRSGLGFLMFLIGFISVNLAIFNLLPMPPLDGGNLVLLGYEVVRRKPPSRRTQEVVQMIGIFLLLSLLIFVTVNDIFRLWPEG